MFFICSLAELTCLKLHAQLLRTRFIPISLYLDPWLVEKVWTTGSRFRDSQRDRHTTGPLPSPLQVFLPCLKITKQLPLKITSSAVDLLFTLLPSEEDSHSCGESETASGEIARHSTFEISGKKMTTSTNLVSVHTNLLCV